MIHYYLTMIENTIVYVSAFFAFATHDTWSNLEFQWQGHFELDFLFRHREHKLLVINHNAIDGQLS